MPCKEWNQHCFTFFHDSGFIQGKLSSRNLISRFDPDHPEYFSYEAKRNSWRFERASVEQTDNHSCGVLLCVNAWKIFDSNIDLPHDPKKIYRVSSFI